MSKLADILQEEVLGEIDQILNDAKSRSEEIVRQAEKDAAARLSDHRKRVEAEENAAAQRARSAADLIVSTARLKARGEVIEQTRQKAMAGIRKGSSGPGYGEVLRALAEEAMKAMEEAETVIVNPADKDNLASWAAERGLELETDPDLQLGIRIVNRSGKTVENTLPERLNRAWDALVSQVARMLWE